MGTISSSTGLISGMDIESIVTQLMAVEARPKAQIETRIKEQTGRQTALMALQAKVMAIQISASSFNKDNIFKNKAVKVGNEDIFTATASQFAQQGNYNLTVKQLASAHQFVSRSYASLTSSVGSGTLSFEVGNGQVNRQTELSQLNGGSGVQRGQIQITDRAGNTAQIDLRTAQTVQDVLDEINYNSKINVTASVSGGRIVVEDTTGGTGNLIVADLKNGRTAQDLGIAASVASAQIDGGDVARISLETQLKSLNDGNGIRGLDAGRDDLNFTLSDGTLLAIDLKTKMHQTVGSGSAQATTLQSLNSGAGVRGGEFRISDQNGRSVDVDMDDFKARYGSRATLAQLNDFIQEEVGRKYAGGEMAVDFSFNSMDHIVLRDKSTLEYKGTDTSRIKSFTVEDLNGGSAAADLGIVSSVKGATINGRQIWFMESVGDVINAVNNHWNNTGALKLQIDAAGKALQMADTSGGAGTLRVEAAGVDRFAALDLGLLSLDGSNRGRNLIAGLNTVMLRSLNGGSGSTTAQQEFAGGTLRMRNGQGERVEQTFGAGASLNDVIDWINESVDGMTARVNRVGNGLIVSADGGGALAIEGELAGFLNIARTGAEGDASADSGNLQLQYVSRATLLGDLRQGEGVRMGKFKLTDGTGAVKEVDLAVDGIKTVGDVIDRINTVGTNVRARINDTGDGILLYDTSAGYGLKAIQVAESGGSTASDLGLLQAAVQQPDGAWTVDGSFELKLQMGGGDTIEDLVARINGSKMGVQAGLINDGSGYRISFVSQLSGRRGNVHLDPGDTTLSTETLSAGRDALVLLGDGTSTNPLLITGTTNTIQDAVKGVTVELKAVSDQPVSIEVNQDLDSVTAQMKSFVTAFNDVMKTINSQASYDVASNTKGALYAEHSVSILRQSLISMVQRTVPGQDRYRRLSDIGINLAPLKQETAADANGANRTYAVASVTQLEFDETEFRDAFAADPDAVMQLFLQETTGAGDYIADKLEQLASTSTASTMKTSAESIGTRIKLLQSRSTYLQERLDAKGKQLYQQFYQMEQALSSMQSQQTALSQMQNLLKK